MSDPDDSGREPDILDIIAAETAQIPDEHIEARLRETLRRVGYDPGAGAAFAAACARADTDPRERQRIADITALTEAEDIIYAEALAATARGDQDTALKLLRWCARAGIGESAWLLAIALEATGRLLEAIPWYSCAASDGNERAAIRLARAVGPEKEVIMSGTEDPAAVTGMHSLNPELLLAYQAVFAAIADGWNRKAALLLRDLTPENLDELHVICGDVQVMVEAEQRRRAEQAGEKRT